MGTTTLLLAVIAFTVVTTLVLFARTLTMPDLSAAALAHEADDRPTRIRLLSRVLFTRRQSDAITIDCLLVSVEQAGPGIVAPAGLPFTLQFRTPDTAWFADRVEQLFTEWAADDRELTFELREDHGKVRTVIASGISAVHLELAGAAGLSLGS